MSAALYCRELSALEVEVKHLRTKIKELRRLQEPPRKALLKHLQREGLQKYGGYTVARLTPRPRKRAKPLPECRRDALSFFYQEGVPDPEGFLQKFLATQKSPVARPS